MLLVELINEIKSCCFEKTSKTDKFLQSHQGKQTNTENSRYHTEHTRMALLAMPFHLQYNSLLPFVEVLKRAIYILPIFTSLSSQFHLSPLKPGLSPSVPRKLLLNGKFSVFLHSISATFNRLSILSLNSFLRLASRIHNPDFLPCWQPPINFH